MTHILQARVETHVLARVVTHVLVCYPMVQARVLLHVLARVIMHVHDYYLKICFPIFTNLYFNFKSDISPSESRGKSEAELRPRPRSHSTPNFYKSDSNCKAQRKRFRH